MKTWNCRATPAATIPSIIGSMLRMTRSVSSLRTHHRIAVFAVIGSSPVTRAETGVTAATGLAERMMNRPKVAFQKPITDHGSVTANSSTRMRSTTPKPPAESANDRSQISPTIEARTTRVKNTRRAVRGSEGRVAAMLRVRSDIGCFSSRAGYSGRRVQGPIGMTASAQALWYVAPGKAEIRAEPVAPPAEGEVRVRAVASALSRGTERLIFSGGVPESEYERMRAPFMDGALSFSREIWLRDGGPRRGRPGRT